MAKFSDLIRIGDLEIGDGYRTKRSELGTPGLPILRVSEVLDGRIEPDFADFVSESYRGAMGSKVSRPGDVVLTTKGTVGRVAIMPADSPEFVYSPQVCFFRTRSDGSLDGRYLYYWFRSESFWSQARSLKSQTDMADYINLADIKSLEIDVPQRPVQAAAVDVLGALDDKIAVNNLIVRSSLALGDACFNMVQSSAARRAAMTELAADKTLTFGDGYRTKRSEHGCPGLPILRVAEVMDGRIEPEFADFVSESYRSAMGGKVSQSGDVILTTKGTVGRVAAISDKDPSFVYSPQLCYFRVLAGSVLSSSHVYFWLRSSDFWRQAESRKSQTDMADYLSLTDIRKLTIPMPTSETDLYASATLSSLLAKISACHEESKVLANLRDTLLPKLVSGEIHVCDAEKVVEGVT